MLGNIFILILFSSFTALLIGTVLIGNEGGKLMSYSNSLTNLNPLKIGISLIILGFLITYSLNFFILTKYQFPSQSVSFRLFIYPWIFHWLTLMVIFYAGTSIAFTYFELIIDRENSIITLNRKAKLTESPNYFEIAFDSIDGFIITGPGNTTITEKTKIFYLHLFKSENDKINRIFIGKRDYILSYTPYHIIEIIFSLHSTNNFKWLIMVDGEYFQLKASIIENSNESNFLENIYLQIHS